MTARHNRPTVLRTAHRETAPDRRCFPKLSKSPSHRTSAAHPSTIEAAAQSDRPVGVERGSCRATTQPQRSTAADPWRAPSERRAAAQRSALPPRRGLGPRRGSRRTPWRQSGPRMTVRRATAHSPAIAPCNCVVSWLEPLCQSMLIPVGAQESRLPEGNRLSSLERSGCRLLGRLARHERLNHAEKLNIRLVSANLA